jgi:thiamine-monophosphate kinase
MIDQGPAPLVSGEESFIREFFAPLAAGYPGAFGLIDDCAAISPPPSMDLVIKTDPIRSGVHFFADDEPADIAWKALAVNVSDLAAKGAEPLAYLASLSFSEIPDRVWMQALVRGLAEAQTAFGCHLIGGDTDRAAGPFSICITAIGLVPAGGMIRRGTAKPGDLIFVSGTIGDACLGLDLRRGILAAASLRVTDHERLLQRYLRPTPRLGLRDALRAHASAAMDISDGLIKDLERLCRASGVSGHLCAADVPLDSCAANMTAGNDAGLARLLTAGDDYEILCTVPEPDAPAFIAVAAAAGVPVTCIGSIANGAGLTVSGRDGSPMRFTRTGWDHF